MSDLNFEHAVRDWLEDGSDRTPTPAIHAVLLAVKTTPQERGLGPPWRFTTLPGYLRLAASLAIVTVVGIGALIYLDSPGPAAPRPTPTVPPTAIPKPTTAPTPASTEVAPGITGWTTYTSAIYGATFGYPSDWSVRAPATRNRQGGDASPAFPADELPYADTFISPGDGDAQIGLIVWQGHIDIFTGTAELKALAGKFCVEVVAPSCETFAQRVVPLDFNNGGRGGCAILVPGGDQQYAMLSDRSDCLLTEATSWLTFVVVTREDDFPSAVRYGGSVELLKSVIKTMSVWRPGQQPRT